MLRLGIATVVLLCLAAVLGVAQQNGSAGGPSVAAARLAGSVQLDGRLDEPEWSEAGMAGELVQQSPRPGEATPYRTTVRVLVSSESLYFGFECTDPDPARIAVHTKQRDGVLTGDDTVTIVLDTYADRRTGYFFKINAAAARVDGLISGPEEPKLDWDGIWEAKKPSASPKMSATTCACAGPSSRAMIFL